MSRPPGDRVLRAISDDGAFRVITVDTTRTARGAIEVQRVEGDLAGLFADLVTASVIVRETMSPDLRVQTILQAEDHKSRMIADAHPDATTRGLVHLAGDAGGRFDLGPEARLQVARTLHNGGLQQGVVAVPEDSGISGALMAYMQSSEQVISFVSVGAHMREGEVVAAGGYIVQLLPEVGEGPLMVMTERLHDFPPMTRLLAEGKAEPRALLSELLYGMPHTELAESELRFGCNCSEERVLSGIATLPRRDVKELYDKGEVLEIACDFCRREYRIEPERLRGLLGLSN